MVFSILLRIKYENEVLVLYCNISLNPENVRDFYFLLVNNCQCLLKINKYLYFKQC